MQLKAVFLDLDHTLTDTDGADELAYESTMAVAAEAAPGIDTAALQKSYMTKIAAMPFDPKETIPVAVWRTDLWAQVLGEQDIDSAELAQKLHDHFYRERIRFFCYFPGAETVMAALRPRYLTVVVTNGDSEIQWPKIKRCDVEAKVDAVVVSGDRRIHKPDARIFAEACERAGCLPEEAIHVGDSLKTDIQGGINAGLAATVWVANPDAVVPNDGPKPTHRISEIGQLPTILSEHFND